MTAEEVYFDPKLPTAIGGAVLVGPYLYGTSQAMMCVDFKTGQVKWNERSIGAASLAYADGLLYLHGEDGEVALVEASPEAYREKGRFTPPNAPAHANQMEKSWAYPVIADGRLYIRDLDTLSVMATQASAITFLSTPGQAYVDGMRFVQFYFGLPIAMVDPLVHGGPAVPPRASVYTAYEYLEQRFDAQDRALVSGIFLHPARAGARHHALRARRWC